MFKARVSKMGINKIINLPTDSVIRGDIVKIKLKSKNLKLLIRVSSMGDRKIAIVPRIYHSYFGEKEECYVEILH
jgi:hypothetical protein